MPKEYLHKRRRACPCAFRYAQRHLSAHQHPDSNHRVRLANCIVTAVVTRREGVGRCRQKACLGFRWNSINASSERDSPPTTARIHMHFHLRLAEHGRGSELPSRWEAAPQGAAQGGVNAVLELVTWFTGPRPAATRPLGTWDGVAGPFCCRCGCARSVRHQADRHLRCRWSAPGPSGQSRSR